MTRSLVVDTSTSRTSVGVFKDGAMVWEGFHDGAMDHGRALAELVARALNKLDSIDEVHVGMGPGPYTGLRVGIAFARAFAFARDLPIFGFCSLDAIASTEGDYIAVTDARRKEVYWALYKNGARVDGPFVDFPADLPQGRYVGEGAVKYNLSEHSGFPNLHKALTLRSNITEAIYLRRPDALPTSEQR